MMRPERFPNLKGLAFHDCYEERAAKPFLNSELDRAKAAAEREHVEALVQQLHAQVWIQHDLLEYASCAKRRSSYD
jgi:hypothetical protein